MLVPCSSCGNRIPDRVTACPFCKTARTPDPPAAKAKAAATVPAARVPFEASDDPTATLPPSPAMFFRSAPTPAPPPPPPVPPAPAPPPVSTATLPPRPEPPPKQKPDADSLALQAEEHLKAGRFEDALTTVDRLLSTQPRNGEAQNTRAQALFKLGRREDAASAIVKAIEASPDSLPFWLNKAVMERQEGKVKQAFRSAIDLIEIAQHIETGSPLEDQGRQMVAAFEKTGAFPNTRGYLGWLALGCVSMKAGRPEPALDFFDRVIDASPDKPDGLRWKGKALAQLDQIDEALALFDAALEIAPNDPEVHYERGMAFAILGDAERALEAFDAALAIDPHHAASLREKRDLS